MDFRIANRIREKRVLKSKTPEVLNIYSPVRSAGLKKSTSLIRLNI